MEFDYNLKNKNLKSPETLTDYQTFTILIQQRYQIVFGL